MSFTVFTIRCLPVVLVDIDATGLTIQCSPLHNEGHRIQHKAPAESTAPPCEGSQASSPFLAFGSLATGDDAVGAHDEEEEEATDVGKEYCILSKTHGVISLSSTSETVNSSFDPEGTFPVEEAEGSEPLGHSQSPPRGGASSDSEHSISVRPHVSEHPGFRVATAGHDRIVVLAITCRAFGNNESAAVVESNFMWPKVHASLSLVVDWSLLPFSLTDTSFESLLSPVECGPDLDLTNWDDENEKKLESFMEIGKHLKRLLEMRDESNQQFAGLYADLEICEGTFPRDVPPSTGGPLDTATSSTASDPTGGEAANETFSTANTNSSHLGESSSSSKHMTAPPRSPLVLDKKRVSWTMRISCSGKTIVVPDLQPNVKYSARVRPVMGGGATGRESYGSWSRIVTFRTADSLNLQIDNVDDISIAFSWSRLSPNPEHSLSQMQVVTVPHPLKFPNFVASVMEFCCFLYRHIVYGNYICRWREESATEELFEDVMTSTHFVLKDLPPGCLYFLRIQQTPIGQLDVASAEGSGEVSPSGSPQGGHLSPTSDSHHSEDESLSVSASQEFGGGGNRGVTTSQGSWSSRTMCVRTIGELKPHLTPLGGNVFKVVVARPGFEDDRYHNTADEAGRMVYLHKPRDAQMLFTQLRVLSDFRGVGKGLLEVSDDGDLLPGYNHQIVDGDSYWRSVNAEEHHWAERSNATDFKCPFHEATVDFSVVRETHSALSRSAATRYYVVNLYPSPSAVYHIFGLRDGCAHQIQVRSRLLSSMMHHAVATATNSASSTATTPPLHHHHHDPRVVTGSSLTPWSTPSLFLTYPKADLSVTQTTETTISFALTRPPAMLYTPADSPTLQMLELEVIAFTAGDAGGQGENTAAPSSRNEAVQSIPTQYDASDRPHRVRSHTIRLSRQELADTSNDQVLLLSKVVSVGNLLPGGAGIATVVPFYGDIRGPSSVVTLFHTVSPVAVAVCGASSCYVALSLYRRPPLWQESLSALDHFLGHQKKGKFVSHSDFRKGLPTELSQVLLNPQLHPAGLSTSSLTVTSGSSLRLFSPSSGSDAKRKGTNAPGDAQLDGTEFEIEVRTVDKESMQEFPCQGYQTTRTADGKYLVCNLLPSTLYRMRGRPLATATAGTAAQMENSWSRASIIATMQALSLQLVSSFETRLVFSVMRRQMDGIPKWAARELAESMKDCQHEYLELALRSGVGQHEQQGSSSSVSSTAEELAVGTLVKDVDEGSSVIRIQARLGDAAVLLEGLSSGCSYPIAVRPVPTVGGAVLSAPECKAVSVFQWSALGSVVTCPFSPTIPTLYELKEHCVAFHWSYSAEKAHAAAKVYSLLPTNRKLSASDVGRYDPSLPATLHEKRIASVIVPPNSEDAANRRFNDLAAASKKSQAAGATLTCPPSYVATPYSAAHVSFRVQAVTIPTGLSHTDSHASLLFSQEDLATYTLGEVPEAFAKISLSMPIPMDLLANRLFFRLKAIVSLVKPVGGEATQSGGGHTSGDVERMDPVLLILPLCERRPWPCSKYSPWSKLWQSCCD